MIHRSFLLLVGISIFQIDDAEIFWLISPSKEERFPKEHMLSKLIFKTGLISDKSLNFVYISR